MSGALVTGVQTCALPISQFDMKCVETAGLVKFDFLGLKTLSVLKEARRLLALRGVDVDLDTLAWDDADAYELLQRGDPVGVFQLESEGMESQERRVGEDVGRTSRYWWWQLH